MYWSGGGRSAGRSWAEGDRAGEGGAFAYPGLNLRAKDFGERAGVEVLGDDTVLGVEEAGFGEEGVCLLVLAEDAGFASLLDEFGDVLLVSDGERHGVVVVAGVELDGLGELRLRRRRYLYDRAGGRQRGRRLRRPEADVC